MTTLTSGIAAFVVAVILGAVTPTTSRADGGRLWDESHQLSLRQRGDLQKRLASVTQLLGSPVFVLVVDKLRHQTAAALAAQAFIERSLGGDDESTPVLLVLAVHDRAAAIETGKGNAGIVPEVDAIQITRRMLLHLSRADPTAALARAIDEIVTSARATAERRRPLSPEADLRAPDEPSPPTEGDQQAGSDAGNTADSDSPAAGTIAPDKPAEKPRSRSRIPIAAAIAVLLLLALAIRRRRHLIASRSDVRRR